VEQPVEAHWPPAAGVSAGDESVARSGAAELEGLAACGKSPARRCAAALGRDRGVEMQQYWLKYEQISTTKIPAQGRKQRPRDFLPQAARGEPGRDGGGTRRLATERQGWPAEDENMKTNRVHFIFPPATYEHR